MSPKVRPVTEYHCFAVGILIMIISKLMTNHNIDLLLHANFFKSMAEPSS